VPAAVATAEPAEPPAAALPTEQPTAAVPSEQPVGLAPAAGAVPSLVAREAATPETPVVIAAAPTSDAPHGGSQRAANSAGSDPANRSGSARSTSANRQSTVVAGAAVTPASTGSGSGHSAAAASGVSTLAATATGAAGQPARVEVVTTAAADDSVAPLTMSAEPQTVPAQSGVLAALLAPLLAPGPAAPVEPPTMWVTAAAARRQFGQQMSNEPSAVTASPILTSQSVDTTAVPAMSTFAVAAAPVPVTVANAAAATTAAPAFVQVKAATPQTNQSSVAVTYTGAQVAGNTNILAIGWNNATSSITSVTDSAGNTYQLAVPTARGSGVSQAIYYAPNIRAAAAGTNTVTTTFSAATPYVDIRALEYSGLDPVNPFNVGTSASGTGTSASSGTVNTTTANALIFGAGITTGGFSTAGANFTTRIITRPDADIAQDRLVTSAGAYSATAPLGGSAAWVMQVAAFKAAGAAGGDTTPPTAPSGQLVFNGDFSTGNFSQWYLVQNKLVSGGSVRSNVYTPGYPLTIVTDPVKGFVGKFEARHGDVAAFDKPWAGTSVERDVLSQNRFVIHESDDLWVAFSIKFDPSFPADLGSRASWVTLAGFHPSVDASSQILTLAGAEMGNNRWGISTHRYDTAQNPIDVFPVWVTPIVRNQWNDLVYHIKFGSGLSGPTAGSLEVWMNGVKQTFTAAAGGGQIYHGQTIVPGATAYPKIGLYRAATAETHIVYYTGYRIATGRAALS